MRLHVIAASVVAAAGLCWLTGCSQNFSPSADVLEQTNTGVIRGNLHGGRQPIIGAHIYMFAAGTGANAGPGIAPATANKSTSLLSATYTNSSFPTAQDATMSDATYNDYYVTTDVNGDFAVGGAYTPCTPGTQIYLYSVGGQPSPGLTNNAAAEMAVLGNCPSGGSLAAQAPVVYINEVSTIAAAYAFAGYASDALHVSSDGTTLATLGIKNAFANAAQLFDISGVTNGVVARSATAHGSGTVPQMKVNALANSIAACVNSTGSGSAQCTTNLFNAVMSSGASGSTATDTATEAIYIAQNPSTAVSTVFGNAAAIGTPYLPTLSSTPNDLTVGIIFTGSFSSPEFPAFDASGNMWMPNSGNNSVSVLSPLGVQLTGFPAGTGAPTPTSVAIDSSGSGWVTNFGSNNFTVLSSAGVALYGTPTTESAITDTPIGIAIDGYGTAYIPTNSGNNVAAFTSAANVSSKSGFGSDTTAGEELSAVLIVGVDASENIWTASQHVPLAVSKFNNSGVGQLYYAAPSTPNALAIDHSNNVWVTLKNGDLLALNNSGTPLAFSPLSGGGLNGGSGDSIGMAIDGASNIFVANYTNGCIAEYTDAGSAVSPSAGYSVSSAFGVAVDGSGNVWVSSNSGNTVTEFIGLGVPVVTPLSYGIANNSLGLRP
jgi:hypothetical protein